MKLLRYLNLLFYYIFFFFYYYLIKFFFFFFFYIFFFLYLCYFVLVYFFFNLNQKKKISFLIQIINIRLNNKFCPNIIQIIHTWVPSQLHTSINRNKLLFTLALNTLIYIKKVLSTHKLCTSICIKYHLSHQKALLFLQIPFCKMIYIIIMISQRNSSRIELPLNVKIENFLIFVQFIFIVFF